MIQTAAFYDLPFAHTSLPKFWIDTNKCTNMPDLKYLKYKCPKNRMEFMGILEFFQIFKTDLLPFSTFFQLEYLELEPEMNLKYFEMNGTLEIPFFFSKITMRYFIESRQRQKVELFSNHHLIDVDIEYIWEWALGVI